MKLLNNTQSGFFRKVLSTASLIFLFSVQSYAGNLGSSVTGDHEQISHDPVYDHLRTDVMQTFDSRRGHLSYAIAETHVLARSVGPLQLLTDSRIVLAVDERLYRTPALRSRLVRALENYEGHLNAMNQDVYSVMLDIYNNKYRYPELRYVDSREIFADQLTHYYNRNYQSVVFSASYKYDSIIEHYRSAKLIEREIFDLFRI